MEYEKKAHSSGVAKAALATGITGAALGVLNGGGILNGLVGGQGRMCASGCGGTVAFADNCCYVTEKEMSLQREIGSKDSVIARLEAERYADRAIDIKTAPLNARICELETATAVNAARDQDFRRYVEREFVHQPKATMRESIVVCKQCGCESNCC